MRDKLYVITAYRWGNMSEHSYLLGVFTDLDKAKKVADSHCKYRGGKYACVVEECELNYFDNDDDDYTEEIYRAKSIRN